MTQYTNTILHDTNKYNIVDPTTAVVGNTTNNIIVYAFTTEAMLLSSLMNPYIRPSRLWQDDIPVIEYYGIQARPVSSAYPIYTPHHRHIHMAHLCWASERSAHMSSTPALCYWQVFSTPCVHQATGSQVYGITWTFPME